MRSEKKHKKDVWQKQEKTLKALIHAGRQLDKERN